MIKEHKSRYAVSVTEFYKSHNTVYVSLVQFGVL